MMPEKKKAAEARAQLRNQIDENLRRVYETSLSEDLPDRFRDLLAKLRDLPGDPAEGGKS